MSVLFSDWRKEPEKEIYFFKCHSTRINKKAFGIARYTTDLALSYAETQLDKISMRKHKNHDCKTRSV